MHSLVKNPDKVCLTYSLILLYSENTQKHLGVSGAAEVSGFLQEPAVRSATNTG